MKTLLAICMVLGCFLDSRGAMDAGGKLERLPTSPLPLDFPVYRPKRTISLENAIIVAGEYGRGGRGGVVLQRAFRERWHCSLPLVAADAVPQDGRPLILFGQSNGNSWLMRLNANGLLAENPDGFELRTIPDALDWKRDILYFGGPDEKAVLRGIERFFEKFPASGTVPHFMECENHSGHPVAASEVEAPFAALQERISGRSRLKNYYGLDTDLAAAAAAYRLEGSAERAEILIRMLRLYGESYDRCYQDDGDDPPHFVFYRFPQIIDLIEEDSGWTEADARMAAELMRKVSEQITLLPFRTAMENYDAGKVEPLSNSICFSARSMAAVGRYFASHYPDYAPPRYFTAVADTLFDAVAVAPFSPEDAAGYQFLAYAIFMDYAQASGRYPRSFFDNPEFRAYIEYCKALFCHRGCITGFGDAQALQSVGCEEQLRVASDILGDTEAEFLLGLIERNATGAMRRKLAKWNFRRDLPAPGLETLGLLVTPAAAAKQQWFGIPDDTAPPAIDKAVFRGGWEDGADFLSVTGIHGGVHGHFDANGIGMYWQGRNLWLFEGDYVRRYPQDHNSLVVCRDGQAAELSEVSPPIPMNGRFARLRAAVQNRERDSALLSSMLEECNGVDWTRNIAWERGNGFWVIDELQVRRDGHYVAETVWRGIGEWKPHAQGVVLSQRAGEAAGASRYFFISSGDGSGMLRDSRLECCHALPNGVLDAYRLAGPETRVVRFRKEGDWRSGDRIELVQFLTPRPGENPAPVPLLRLEEGVFLAMVPEFPRLALRGSWKTDGLDVEAERLFIGPQGVTGLGVRRLLIGTRRYPVAPDGTIALSATDLPPETADILRRAGSAGTFLPITESAPLAVPEKQAVARIDFSAAVTALAEGEKKFGVGLADGTFLILDQSGAELFRRKLAGPIVAAVFWDAPSGRYWAVGCGPAERGGEGRLYLLDEEGNVRTERAVPNYGRRYGRPVTLFTADFSRDGKADALVVGSEGWSYSAYDAQLRELWISYIYHAATHGIAADLDGDGRDEVVAGSEYYDLSILDAQGQRLSRENYSPEVTAVAVMVDGDARQYAVTGRSDGYVYFHGKPGKNERLIPAVNVGGKPMGMCVLQGGDKEEGRLFVGAASGTLTWFDGPGKRSGMRQFPAPIAAVTGAGDRMLVICEDGFAYLLDGKGIPRGRISCVRDPDDISRPMAVMVPGTAALASGRGMILLRESAWE